MDPEYTPPICYVAKGVLETAWWLKVVYSGVWRQLNFDERRPPKY